MNSLITECLKRKEPGLLADFPRKLMIGHEEKQIDWILWYVSRYGAAPTLAIFTDEFEDFIPVPISKDVPTKAIRDRLIKKRLLTITSVKLAEAQSIVESDSELPLDVLGELQALIVSTQGVHHFSEFDRMSYAEEKGLRLGFKLIDAATGGIHNGDYGLIVGRLGTGKTLLTLWVTYQWWLKGKRILVVSNESLPKDVFSRLDAMATSFNPLILRSISIPELKELAKRIDKAVKGKEGDIIVPQRRLITPSQVGTMAKHLNAEAVIIDGVYLMRTDRQMAGSKWERVAAVSNDLKQMALDLELPLLGVAQLKRVGDKMEYDPEDIAYSDALGQDADFIIAVRQNKIVPDTAELQLIKNRYGSSIGTQVRIDFDKMKIIEESVSSEVVEEPKEGGKIW